MTGKSARRRVGALDGVRGIALLGVLGYHVAPRTFRGGFLGVDIFFVLSGFLLTTLLLDEHANKGAIDFLAYAGRRVRRIAPALFVLLLGLVLLVPIVAAAEAHRLRGDVLSSLAGVTNWHLIQDGSSYFSRFGRPPFVRHLWSVAVEIQFYVLCPFLVAWLARRRRALAIGAVAAGIAVSATIMALLYRADDASRAYFGTDARASALLMGVLLAVVLFRESHRADQRLSRPGDLLAVVAVGVLVVLVASAGEQSRWMYPAGFLLAEAATALVITLALRPGWPAELLSRRELRWLGTRSYGIYLWHWPLVALVGPGTSVDWPVLPTAVVTIAGALVLGSLSFRYVERPFLGRHRPLRVRARAKPEWAVSVCLVMAALLVVAGARLWNVPTENPLAQVLHAGDAALQAQPLSADTTTTLAPTATTTVPPTTLSEGPVFGPPAPQPVAPPSPQPQPQPEPEPQPDPVAVPPPLPAGGIPVTLIGDSVMVTAADALVARFGDSAYIDAQQNRFFRDGARVAAGLRQQGRLGNVVVVHLGNNGPMTGEEVDALMAELADVPNVLLVTVRVNKSWQDSVNETLHDAAARYSTVRLVDWYGFSAGQTGWFQGDGTHFKTTSGPGANGYADLIFGAIPR